MLVLGNTPGQGCGMRDSTDLSSCSPNALAGYLSWFTKGRILRG